MVPMNVNLKSGDVIKVVLQGATSGKESPEPDEKKSGNYLIKELRHHFEMNKNGNVSKTSKRLLRNHGVIPWKTSSLHIQKDKEILQILRHRHNNAVTLKKSCMN